MDFDRQHHDLEGKYSHAVQVTPSWPHQCAAPHVPVQLLVKLWGICMLTDGCRSCASLSLKASGHLRSCAGKRRQWRHLAMCGDDAEKGVCAQVQLPEVAPTDGVLDWRKNLQL